MSRKKTGQKAVIPGISFTFCYSDVGNQQIKTESRTDWKGQKDRIIFLVTGSVNDLVSLFWEMSMKITKYELHELDLLVKSSHPIWSFGTEHSRIFLMRRGKTTFSTTRARLLYSGEKKFRKIKGQRWDYGFNARRQNIKRRIEQKIRVVLKG